jgi:predicted anti-sigma-YlaC factor YlaD
MDCAEAKHLIHLDVGDDLRVDEEQQLAGHMGQCGECRSYHSAMSRALNVLTALRHVPSENVHGSSGSRSVWPAISREIQRRQTAPARVSKFNLQIVALSVCSLSLAVVTIVQSLSSMRSSTDSGSFVPAQHVRNSVSASSRNAYSAPQREAVPQYLIPGLQPVGTSRPQSF